MNFDPANMLLYGAGDPIEAVHVLGRHIAHVHVKDAILSDQPAVTWGKEVPFGAGQVNPTAFLASFANPVHASASNKLLQDNKWQVVWMGVES